jgi:hypothetical protein
VAATSTLPDRPFLEPSTLPWCGVLEANSAEITAELEHILVSLHEIPNFPDVSPRQRRLTRDSGWKTFFLFATYTEWSALLGRALTGANHPWITQDPAGVCIRQGECQLRFSLGEWSAFVQAIRAGECEPVAA